MATLDFLGVCEKCLLDERQNVTLVNLLFGLEVKANPPQGAVAIPKIPKNAVIPNQWAIYVRWKPEDGDAGKDFVQKGMVFWPDGTDFVALNPSEFKFEKGKHHQIRADILGFPAGQVGNVVVKVWLEWDRKRIGEEKTWSISVTHG